MEGEQSVSSLSPLEVAHSNAMLICIISYFDRNFVREDRLRRENSFQSSSRDSVESVDLGQKLLDSVPTSNTTDVDSKGRKILLKKTQADLLHKLQKQGIPNVPNVTQFNSTSHNGSTGADVQHKRNIDADGGVGGSGDIPFLSTNREGVVQSRLIRFSRQPSVKSRERSPTPPPSTDISSIPTTSSSIISTPETPNGTHQNEANEKQMKNMFEKTVFGISPKSSSLSR